MKDQIDRDLIAKLQEAFPVEARPFRVLGEQLGAPEAEVIERIARLKQAGKIRGISAVFEPRRLGAVTALAALEVAPEQLDAVAAAANAFPEVTHNYEREHDYNLWFAIVAADAARLREVFTAVANTPGVRRAALAPAVRTFKIAVNFRP